MFDFQSALTIAIEDFAAWACGSVDSGWTGPAEAFSLATSLDKDLSDKNGYRLRKIAIELALPTYSSKGSVSIFSFTKFSNSG